MRARKQEKIPKGKPLGSVNLEVDTILRLVPLSGFEPRERDRHRIRLLQGAGCNVLGALSTWARSSRNEYKKAIKGLRLIAENDDLPKLATVKRVGASRRIIQIAGDSGRLYCFMDADGGYTVICVNTFWIGSGNKLEHQNREIEEAERLMELWQNAIPVEGPRQGAVPVEEREEIRVARRKK